MTDLTATGAPRSSILVEDARTKKRNAAEKRFRLYGLGALSIGVTFLVILLAVIISRGIPAFTQTFVALDVPLSAEVLDPDGEGEEAVLGLSTFGYQPLLDAALVGTVEANGIETELGPEDLGQILSASALAELRDRVQDDPSLVGQTVTVELLAASRVDGYLKGRVTRESLARDSNLSAGALDVIDALRDEGLVERRFNLEFITGADASESRPEQAGIGVSVLGSFAMMLVVLALALPIGVAASIYLEEFAPENRFTDFIEVNIANLAAVPSIVFGILGLAIFINFAGLPQSAPIVGGLVLTLMTLPTIIIATRASLKAVPPSIREAALGVGASKMQTVFHHVLPLAAPGILTGTIIGLAQALGETAPLLLIGMVAFVREYPAGPPEGFFDPASALPVQVYNWTTRSDPAFVERASGAIIVLLVFLLIMNTLAIILRRRFERRW